MSLLLKRPFVRNAEGESLLEIFLVTAVASVLLIRFFLEITGYPRIEGGGLHIAHVLLGGLFMLASIVVLLAYIDKAASHVAAVLGGFGFGAFIDEVGKFVTGDNDYFFRPAVAIIYVSFILLFLAVEAIKGRPELTPQEKLINALDITKEAVLKDLDHQERKKALELLEGLDPRDPVSRALSALLQEAEPVPVPTPGIYTRGKHLARCFYAWSIGRRWFSRAVIAFFVLQSLFTPVLWAAFLLAREMLVYEPISLSFADLGGLASSAIAGGFTVAGIMKIRADRLEAYMRFRDAILVQILLVQVFAFYIQQLLALLVLAGNILVLLVLRYVIGQERAGPSCDIGDAGGWMALSGFGR